MREEIEHLPLSAPPGTAELLSSLVHENTGILFEPDRFDVLLDKIRPLAAERGCASFLDYYYLLKYRENGNADWGRVMDALSVLETYFWREFGQIDVFVKKIVPAWFQKTSAPLRVWCAACASGEEPYTIAIALMEAGWGGHPIEINASDASIAALEMAKRAVYREKSFRSMPPELRYKYFKAVEGGWQLAPEVTRRVIFQQANLMAASEIAPLARSHAVFCRNVFIYFSRHSIRLALASFAARMAPGGYLFVGAAESLLRLTVEYELCEMGEVFVYRRI